MRKLDFLFNLPVQSWKKSFRHILSASVSQLVKTSGNCHLEEMQGRPWKLFLSPVDTAIAHCVSSDFQMDRGIAKQFLKKYGSLEELIEKGLAFPEGHEVGKFAVLKTKERYVYYLITRNKWWNPASYSAMEQSLHALRTHCDERNINSLAIPRLGAQYDRLEWNKVREIIIDVFKDSSISITAYTQR